MAANWQEKRPFEETNFHMLNDNVLSDVTFLMGSDKTEVKAHRFMLASRSPVFFVMFCGELSETSGRIEIKDIEADTMNTLLRFIYTEDCTVTGESVMALLYAAKKYNIKRLEEKCQTFLSEQISCENVCDIFRQAHMLSEMELKQKCFNFILTNGKQVLQTEGFIALPKELLREILEADSLQEDEHGVYISCKKWAKQQLLKSDENRDIGDSDIRNALGDLLYLIRFPVMTAEFFTTSCSKDDSLTPVEKVSIFQFILSEMKDSCYKFNVKGRIGDIQKKIKKHIIQRFLTQTTSDGWGYSGSTIDAISFSVSKPVTFMGIGLFVPIEPGKIKGSASILGKDESVIINKTVELNNASSNRQMDVLFDEAILLAPHTTYTIMLKLNGSNTCCGADVQTEVEQGDTKITFSNSEKSNNGTSVNKGQIPYLILGIADSN